MSVSGVSAGSSSGASYTTQKFATAGILGIVAVTATAFSPATAEVDHPPAIQEAEARAKLAELDKDIANLSDPIETLEKQIEHAQLCFTHADLIRNVASSNALERTASQNRAYNAAVNGARLSVQGRALSRAGNGPDAFMPWIQQVHFLAAASRHAPNNTQAAEHLRSAAVSWTLSGELLPAFDFSGRMNGSSMGCPTCSEPRRDSRSLRTGSRRLKERRSSGYVF